MIHWIQFNLNLLRMLLISLCHNFLDKNSTMHKNFCLTPLIFCVKKINKSRIFNNKLTYKSKIYKEIKRKLKMGIKTLSNPSRFLNSQIWNKLVRYNKYLLDKLKIELLALSAGKSISKLKISIPFLCHFQFRRKFITMWFLFQEQSKI